MPRLIGRVCAPGVGKKDPLTNPYPLWLTGSAKRGSERSGTKKGTNDSVSFHPPAAATPASGRCLRRAASRAYEWRRGDHLPARERVHLGGLMFHQRHPVGDRAAGASNRNWGRVLDQVVSAHARNPTHIFGHAYTGPPSPAAWPTCCDSASTSARSWRSSSGRWRRAARASRSSRCASH